MKIDMSKIERDRFGDYKTNAFYEVEEDINKPYTITDRRTGEKMEILTYWNAADGERMVTDNITGKTQRLNDAVGDEAAGDATAIACDIAGGREHPELGYDVIEEV